MVMKPEFPSVDQDRMVSPHAQEVEYALILSRMINTVKEDPSQLRLTIYEFARARLKIDTSWADETERNRLSAALETAIQGVEEFSARREEREQLKPPVQAAQIASTRSPIEPPTSMPAIHQASPAPKDILVPNRVYLRPNVQPIVDVRTRSLAATLARFFIGVVLFALVAALALYKQRTGLDLPSQVLAKLVGPQTKPPIPEIPQQASAPVDPKTVAASPSPLPFPVPSDYGVYALSNSALSELHVLPERVPDKRIVMSTPVDQPSRTTLPDGKTKFVIFRRDLVGNAPERMEVRVVARVMRALTFDAKGKPTFSSISDSWNIRNVSYEFRVRPIAGNPEMLLVQSDNADFALPAGRYVLVLRDQGYDFTVAGKVTEPSQCVERTDAANGTFFSECQKQ
jgi:hypothetical protein